MNKLIIKCVENISPNAIAEYKEQLDINKLKSKKSKTVSTEYSLKDVVPMGWTREENTTSKPLIELITCESGDWEVLRAISGEDFEHEGHSIPSHGWIELLEILGFNVEEKEISDEDMEYGRY